MAYESRQFQTADPATPPSTTDPLVDNTASGDVQAIKLLDPTAGSTTPLIGQKARTGSMPVALSTEDAALLADLLTNTTFAAALPASLGQKASAASLAVVVASDQSAVPVSGAFYQATQPVSGTVTANIGTVGTLATAANQTTGNASLASLDGKAPALGQALAAASVPVVLPAAQITTLTPPAAITGFATAAKQPALGTAGSASADVLSVQGVASMTPLLVNGSGVTQPVNDAGGSLTVDGTVGISGSVAVTGTFWQATQPISGTVTANLAAGTNNIGDVDVLSLPALPAGTNNIGDVDVLSLPALPAGTNNIGDVDVLTLPALAAGTNTIGAVNVKPATSGGLTIYRSLDLDETGVSVKASAGQVYGWFMFNAAASTRYVKLYNIASAPTVGTTTPVLTIPLPAGAAANVEFTNGVAFATGIGVGATTGVADNDTGAPSANDVVVNILYA